MKFRIEEGEALYYPCSKNKGTDQLRSYCKLICAFVFAYEDCWFSHAAAQIIPIFQYLGELEEIRGRTILEEDSEVTLPLITLPGTILVPGQIIPLHLFHQQMVAMIRGVVDSDKTFGVVTVKYVMYITAFMIKMYMESF